MKSNPVLSIAISGILAALVWIFSSHFTGHPEPWDGSFSYYLGTLFLAGFISALIAPLPVWGHYLGVVLGQVAYMVLSGGGALILLGIAFASLWSISALFGAALALAVRFALMRTRETA